MRLDRLLSALRPSRGRPRRLKDWSVYATESRRISLGVKDRQTGNAHAPLNLLESAGVRYLFVWTDGRISRGYLERSQAEGDPDRALDDARQAAYADPDAAWVLGRREIPDVALFDDGAARIADGDLEPIAERLSAVRRHLDASGPRTWSGSFSASRATARLVTSRGIEVAGEGTAFGWHVSLDGEIGDGFAARAPEDHDTFDARLRRLLDTAAELRRDAVPMEGGRHRVLLHPRVVEEYVLETLLSNLEGATVAHGDGHFRREQFGSDEPVLREDLGLRIDPLVPLRRGSYRFTVEGVPAAPCVFIERGRLVRPVLDLKYARRLDLPPTPPPAAADTLHLEGSPPISRDEALERARGGALVLSVLGVHTQDKASGDFSLSAPQVLRIGDGGFAGRLKATLSGNLFEMLRDAELDFVRFDGEHTPGLLVTCRLDPK